MPGLVKIQTRTYHVLLSQPFYWIACSCSIHHIFGPILRVKTQRTALQSGKNNGISVAEVRESILREISSNTVFYYNNFFYCSKFLKIQAFIVCFDHTVYVPPSRENLI